MSIKRKKKGFGVFHQIEQGQSEDIITDLLYNENKSWQNIRDIERKTKLHHYTISKAIRRLKKKDDILEIPGKNRMRLFTSPLSQLAKKIRKDCKNDSKYKRLLLKYNSKSILRINYYPSFYEKHSSGFQNRVRKKRRSEDYDKIYLKAKEKREFISEKNKKLT